MGCQFGSCSQCSDLFQASSHDTSRLLAAMLKSACEPTHTRGRHDIWRNSAGRVSRGGRTTEISDFALYCCQIATYKSAQSTAILGQMILLCETRPLHNEPVHQPVHHTATQRQTAHATEALNEHYAGRAKQPHLPAQHTATRRWVSWCVPGETVSSVFIVCRAVQCSAADFEHPCGDYDGQAGARTVAHNLHATTQHSGSGTVSCYAIPHGCSICTRASLSL